MIEIVSSGGPGERQAGDIRTETRRRSGGGRYTELKGTRQLSCGPRRLARDPSSFVDGKQHRKHPLDFGRGEGCGPGAGFVARQAPHASERRYPSTCKTP